jgi:hypothetical protein
LDKLLGIARKNQIQQISTWMPLEIASLLTEMDFDAELAPRQIFVPGNDKHKANRYSSPGYFTMPHWKWIVAFTVIVFLAVFQAGLCGGQPCTRLCVCS